VILRIEGDRISLHDRQRLDELKVVSPEEQTISVIASALGGTPDPQDDFHVWVPAATILDLDDGTVEGWPGSVRAAFRAVERFGWYDSAHDVVRVHVAR
jgi:hypothetical protein